MPKIDKGTQIRIVLFILVWVNTWLANKGLPHIPFPYINDETAAMVLSMIISGWTSFRNNYITKRGQLQLKALQAQGLAKK